MLPHGGPLQLRNAGAGDGEARYCLGSDAVLARYDSTRDEPIGLAIVRKEQFDRVQAERTIHKSWDNDVMAKGVQATQFHKLPRHLALKCRSQ